MGLLKDVACACGNLQVVLAVCTLSISNAEQLFDMEMAEVTIRLILKALSNWHSISLLRAKE